MRTIEETLNDAKSLVDKIYENMTTVQTCEAIREQIKTMKVCYTCGDENKILVLDRVLDQEQMEMASNLITEMIDNRRDEAAKYLDFLNGKIPAIQNPVFEDAVKDMVSKEVVIIPDKIKAVEKDIPIDAVHKPVPRVSKMQIDEVSDMIKAGKSVEDITKFYGYKSSQTVKNFVEKNNIFVEPLRLDDGKIRACYTNGPFTMKQIADEFHLDTKVMHEYCKERGLLKPNKNDPFRGR